MSGQFHVLIVLDTLLETAGNDHVVHMKIGRKSIPGQNPNRRQGQVPTHPADMGHTVQHTLPVSLLWRAEGPAKNVTGKTPRTKMAILRQKLSLQFRPK